MRRFLPLLLILLLLTSAVAEGFTPDSTLPLVNNNRAYSAFTRAPVTDGKTAMQQAAAWSSLPLLANTQVSGLSLNRSALKTPEGWSVMTTRAGNSAWFLLDEAGRIMRYEAFVPPYEATEYGLDEIFPANTDEAVLSHIQRFADLNGYAAITDYTRVSAQTIGGYELLLSVEVCLDEVPYRFTMKLDEMGFTAISRLDILEPAVLTQREALQRATEWADEQGLSEEHRLVDVLVEDGEITAVVSVPQTSAPIKMITAWGLLPRYTFRLTFQGEEMAVSLSTWQEEDIPNEPFNFDSPRLSVEASRYELVEGRWLVLSGGSIPQGTRYTILEEMDPAERGVVLDGLPEPMSRIRYLRQDGTLGEGWVMTSMTGNAPIVKDLTPTPVATLERYELTIRGENAVLFAVNKTGKGYEAFSDVPEDAMPVEDVLQIALAQALDAFGAEFGITLQDLCEGRTAEYGYLAEGNWQVDFVVPRQNRADDLFEILIQDGTGTVLGVWGPNDGNG